MEIKVLGISGSPVKGGNVETLLNESLGFISGREGVKTELLTLAGKNIEDCAHCNWCITKQTREKVCAKADDMTEIYPKVLEADGFIMATPVYTARLSGRLACFLDRLRCLSHAKYYKHALENKVGGAIAVSWFRSAGVETALLSIIYFFFAQGIIPVGPPLGQGCQWGVPGYSSYEGIGKFDPEDKLIVLKDSYAVKSAQALSEKLANFCGLIKAGEVAIRKTSGGA